MLKTWQYLTLLALGAAAVLLVVTNAILFASNKAEQAELNQRQLFLQQSASLEGLYREMVKALADLAVRSDDRRVLDALAAQGINVTVSPPMASAADSNLQK
jgi:hypothetical protein